VRAQHGGALELLPGAHSQVQPPPQSAGDEQVLRTRTLAPPSLITAPPMEMPKLAPTDQRRSQEMELSSKYLLSSLGMGEPLGPTPRPEVSCDTTRCGPVAREPAVPAGPGSIVPSLPLELWKVEPSRSSRGRAASGHLIASATAEAPNERPGAIFDRPQMRSQTPCVPAGAPVMPPAVQRKESTSCRGASRRRISGERVSGGMSTGGASRPAASAATNCPQRPASCR
jgi:hypothetical protein